MDCDQVMSTIGLADRAAQSRAGDAGIAAGLEIRNQEHHGAPVQHVIHDVERLHGVGTDALRLMEENVSHDAQNVSATFLRRQIPFDAVGVQNQAYFIAVANRGKSQHAGDLRGQIALCHRAGSEISRRTDVNHQKYRELTLLRELLDERTSGTSRHIPIDGPDLVPRAVFADLVKVHSPALEYRVVGARHAVVDHAASADLQLTHAAALRFGRLLHVRHPEDAPAQGTGSVFRIFSTTSLEVTFSASAS